MSEFRKTVWKVLQSWLIVDYDAYGCQLTGS